MQDAIIEKLSYFIAIQPALITTILLCVCVSMVEMIIDFVCSIFIPGWFSPSGWKTRKKRGDDNNETK